MVHNWGHLDCYDDRICTTMHPCSAHLHNRNFRDCHCLGQGCWIFYCYDFSNCPQQFRCMFQYSVWTFQPMRTNYIFYIINHMSLIKQYTLELTSVPIRKFLYKACAFSPDFFSSITFNSIGLPAMLVNLFIFLNPIQNSSPTNSIYLVIMYKWNLLSK